jgi:WD40 repeat protein
LLATTGGDNTLILWDAATGRRKAGPLRGHGIREGQLFPGVRAVVFSPDEKIVATGGDDRDIRLWDAVSGQALGEPMHGHNGALRALLFIDDGQGLVSSDEFGDTRVWSVQDRRPLKILRGYAGRINGLAAVGSHAVLSYGENGKIIQWDPFAWPDRLAVTLVHPSPDARPRVVGATDRRHFPDLLWSVAFSPSGRRLASGADDGAVVVWELSTNQEIARFECQPGQVFALKFSPDESSIACGGLGDVVHIRDLSSGGDTILTGGHPAGSIDFSPDGESVAIGYLDGAIRGFKAHGGAPLFEFQTGGSPVVLVAFVDSGQQLLAVTSKGHVVMWNVGSGKALRESELHNSEPSVALEQDTLAFWMTDRVQLWSVSKWSPIGSVQAPIADRAPHPFHLAVSGSRLAVAQGSMASVWDTRMRSLAWPILDARGSINAVVFDPKGGRIAVVGASAVVSMWSLEWAAWTGLACKVAGHSLSRDDWQRWLGDEPYQRSCESQRRQ